MSGIRIRTERLELVAMPAAVAAALPDDRATAAGLLGSSLADAWPQPDLLDILPIQASATPALEPFGAWVIVERDTNTVVGDIGFLGPPAGGEIEIGFSVIPDRRRRGYASEAARSLVAWAMDQPGIGVVVARSDVDNEASARTLTAAGFSHQGERDGVDHWRHAAP